MVVRCSSITLVLLGLVLCATFAHGQLSQCFQGVPRHTEAPTSAPPSTPAPTTAAQDTPAPTTAAPADSNGTSVTEMPDADDATPTVTPTAVVVTTTITKSTTLTTITSPSTMTVSDTISNYTNTTDGTGAAGASAMRRSLLQTQETPCLSCFDGWWGPNCNAECVCNGNCSDGVNGTGRCTSCDKGFYGPGCLACGCVSGNCSDGLSGDGTCECTGNYTGTLCDKCDDRHYGEKCEHLCPCENGICGNNGTCVECLSGYAGSDCATKCPTCGSGGQCSSGINGTGECVYPPSETIVPVPTDAPTDAPTYLSPTLSPVDTTVAPTTVATNDTAVPVTDAPPPPTLAPGPRYLFVLRGTVEEFDRGNFRSTIAKASNVSASNVEVLTVTPATIVVDWRFAGLNQSDYEMANYMLNETLNGNSTVLDDLGVIFWMPSTNTGPVGPPAVPQPDDDSGLAPGVIAGIVVGVVVGIVVVAAIAYFIYQYMREERSVQKRDDFEKEIQKKNKISADIGLEDDDDKARAARHGDQIHDMDHTPGMPQPGTYSDEDDNDDHGRHQPMEQPVETHVATFGTDDVAHITHHGDQGHAHHHHHHHHHHHSDHEAEQEHERPAPAVVESADIPVIIDDPTPEPQVRSAVVDQHEGAAVDESIDINFAPGELDEVHKRGKKDKKDKKMDKKCPHCGQTYGEAGPICQETGESHSEIRSKRRAEKRAKKESRRHDDTPAGKVVDSDGD